jgi:hypothetical protein
MKNGREIRYIVIFAARYYLSASFKRGPLVTLHIRKIRSLYMLHYHITESAKQCSHHFKLHTKRNSRVDGQKLLTVCGNQLFLQGHRTKGKRPELVQKIYLWNPNQFNNHFSREVAEVISKAV